MLTLNFTLAGKVCNSRRRHLWKVQFLDQTLRYAADAAFAMLAAMQLDVFTPLKGGLKTAEDIAHAIGVGPARLGLLLSALSMSFTIPIAGSNVALRGFVQHVLSSMPFIDLSRNFPARTHQG
jgi:hypothetical protein